MKVSEVFPSQYLASEDLENDKLNGQDTVVISSVERWMSPPRPGEKQIQKLLIHFQNRNRGLICNKTNSDRISTLYGDETDGWIGKVITIAVKFVEYKGKPMKGIRVQLESPNGQNHTVVDKGSYELSQRVRPEKRNYPPVPEDEEDIPF